MNMPRIPKIIKDSCVITMLVGTWFAYYVTRVSYGSIEHYQSPPENEARHNDLLIVHGTTVVILSYWTKMTVFFGILYILE